MFPIKDDNPTEIKPLVTLSIIAICCFIYQYRYNYTYTRIAIHSST